MSARDMLPITMLAPKRECRLARMETTRTGITIGAAYMPPPQRMEGDAVHIQSALLSRNAPLPRSGPRRALHIAAAAVWRWL